ncbi:hypothetical protein [Glutamicibacter nicotianae]|uniref:hypothetical protein n=1 Tax=Glutamicibacter nicotianae TaxID=37929 RepID=UPI0025568BC2|nr:hypothetical protein [Glutamicibacter nicotianae]WIV45291.1 hypothetical protein QQS42_06755 [Glutamicibacter nicotianae]
MRHGNLFAYSRVERNSPSLRLCDPLDKRCEQAEESQKSTHNSTLFRQLNRIVLIAFLIFAYLAVLEYAYRDIVAPPFGYLGYIYSLPDKQWIALGIAQLTVLSLFMPRKISRGSDTIVWIIYVVVVVPISLVPYFESQLAPVKVFGFSTFAAINLLFIARFSSTRILRKFVPIASKSSLAFWSILLIFTIATYGYSFAIFGFRFEIMSMFEVASTRLEYRDEVAPTVPLLGYLVSNQGNVINPLLICIGAAHRRWYLAAFGTLGQLLLYSVTGYKTALLSIIVCILVSVILSKRKSI